MIRSMLSMSTLCVTSVFLLLPVGIAQAESINPSQLLSNEAEYSAARTKGINAFKMGRYEDAARHFRDAFDAIPKGNLLYNIGLSYERAGQLPDALTFYQRFIDAQPESPKRPAVQQKLDALKQRLAGQYHTLDVRTDPPGAAIYVDDKSKGAYGRSPTQISLLPGSYTVIAETPQYETARKRIELRGSGQSKVSLKLMRSDRVGNLRFIISERGANVMINRRKIGRSPLMNAIRLPAGSHEVLVMKPGFAVWRGRVKVIPRKTTPVKIDLTMEKRGALSSSSQKAGSIWPWVTVGIGGALVAGGITTGVLANGLHGKLEDKQSQGKPIHKNDISSGKSLVTMTNVFSSVGGALVVGGLVWWWLDGRTVERRGSLSTTVVPTTDGGAWFQVGGAF